MSSDPRLYPDLDCSPGCGCAAYGRPCQLEVERRAADPMRRPPDVLPLGALMLAVCFVLGFIAGSLSTLLWWVER